mgnify:CR=1 FL=1
MARQDTNTERLRGKLRAIFKAASDAGQTHIDVVSGDLHEATEFKSGSHPNQMPSVCNVMNEFKDVGDSVIHVTPSGRSSTLRIRYKLPRQTWK